MSSTLIDSIISGKRGGQDVFERLESNVRGYCRAYPTIFSTAKNAVLTDESGREYIDFLAGAGTLNYGHNNPHLKSVLLDYIVDDGIVHGLDMYSTAKQRFLEVLDEVILRPREMDYKVQFTGPTGTNAVEAALKLARLVTGRSNVVSFTNGFHGVTTGSVAATANSYYRDAVGVDLHNTTFMPYDGYFGEHADTLAYFQKMLIDSSSGLDLPAAVIVETIQGEGGVNVASYEWLRNLEYLCNEHGVLLIVDDIQAGVGRTGKFFSFEEAQLSPDIITMSKSLSGFGLPFSIVLMKPKLDVWKPGQHNGTFRGHNLAFVTAAEMLSHYWRDRAFGKEVQQKSWLMGKQLHTLREQHSGIVGVRGRGMFFGIECQSQELATSIRDHAFQEGLIVETCGTRDHVVKLLPPLTIENDVLMKGLSILKDGIALAHEDERRSAAANAEADDDRIRR